MKLYASKFTLNDSPVHISDDMSGKMLNIPAISTSVLQNKFCQCRRNCKGSVCVKCFAENTLNRYHGAEKNCDENTELLTTHILTDEEMPVFNPYRTKIVRFEAFGDLNNETQAINYLNIARHNPSFPFALWTKNTGIIKRACDDIGKPSNLVIIQSSMFINRPETARNEYIDKVFTVYDKKYIAENGIDINCGARDCLTCQRCYHINGETDIREQLK